MNRNKEGLTWREWYNAARPRGIAIIGAATTLMPGKYIWAKGVKRHILQNLPDDIHKDDELLAEADDQWNLFIGYRDNEQ